MYQLRIYPAVTCSISRSIEETKLRPQQKQICGAKRLSSVKGILTFIVLLKTDAKHSMFTQYKCRVEFEQFIRCLFNA